MIVGVCDVDISMEKLLVLFVSKDLFCWLDST